MSLCANSKCTQTTNMKHKNQGTGNGTQVAWLCMVIFSKILSARCRASGRPSQAGEAIWALCHKVRTASKPRIRGLSKAAKIHLAFCDSCHGV